MKLTIRLIVSLLLVAILVAGIFSYVQVIMERHQQLDELNRRCQLLAESLGETVKNDIIVQNTEKLKQIVERFGNRERLYGIVIIDENKVELAGTSSLRGKVSKEDYLKNYSATDQEYKIITDTDTHLHVYYYPVFFNEKFIGTIGLFHDISYIDRNLNKIWYYNFLRLLILSMLIIFTTILVVRWSVVGPIAKVADWIRNLRMGKSVKNVEIPDSDLLGPLADEVTQLAKSLAVARTKAQQEARLRILGEKTWTAERLKEHIKMELGDRVLVIVSNREPYMHIKKDKKVECIVPAGGLVSALDPVMRACGGIWIAHGSGDADFETADRNGKLLVPPEECLYTLRRVWLTKEEEEGYYYGFSNEGLWPLCHLTHTRPEFKLNDWLYYVGVNEKFSNAVLEEVKNVDQPLILIQDYHFALLPSLLKEKRPDARVAIFWHIPWPNPEAFSICPWQKEILEGLLGADLIGFHTQFHCNNFLETVDRVVESKINWEKFSIEKGGQLSYVNPFPISVAFPKPESENIFKKKGSVTKKSEIFIELGIEAEFLGLGVDRIDYTKGIIERFKAVDRFFEKYNQYIGKFVFVELGAPSRTHIERYHDLIAEIEKFVENICWKYRSKNWQPIIFLKAHHTHEEIERYYKCCDICMVTSLHDGMNLVAKEFVAARDDENGVLILSQFTGASKELSDSIIVNPYDIEQMADALYLALNMPDEGKKRRMKNLREIVKERNVYWWAGNLISTLNRIRV